MAGNRWYDEDQEVSTFASWVIIILFSASIMIFGWVVYLLIPDGPRYWNFGQLPDTPAESVYSSEVPQGLMKPQPQIPRLPEAQANNPVPAEVKPGGKR